MPIEELRFDAVLDVEPLREGLQRAEGTIRVFSRRAGQHLRSFARTSAIAVGAATAALALLTRSSLRFADDLAKQARNIGIATQELSVYGLAFQLAGASQQVFVKGIQRTAEVVEFARRGLSTYTDALAAANLEYADLAGLAPERQFERILRAIRQLGDESQRIALQSIIFGRAGRQLGSLDLDQIDALRERLIRQGTFLTDNEVRNVERFNDELAILSRTVQNQFARGLASGLSQLRDFEASITAIGGFFNRIGTGIGGFLTNLESVDSVIGRMRESLDLAVGSVAVLFGIGTVTAFAGALASGPVVLFGTMAALAATLLFTMEEARDVAALLGENLIDNILIRAGGQDVARQLRILRSLERRRAEFVERGGPDRPLSPFQTLGDFDEALRTQQNIINDNIGVVIDLTHQVSNRREELSQAFQEFSRTFLADVGSFINSLTFGNFARTPQGRLVSGPQGLGRPGGELPRRLVLPQEGRQLESPFGEQTGDLPTRLQVDVPAFAGFGETVTRDLIGQLTAQEIGQNIGRAVFGADFARNFSDQVRFSLQQAFTTGSFSDIAQHIRDTFVNALNFSFGNRFFQLLGEIFDAIVNNLQNRENPLLSGIGGFLGSLQPDRAHTGGFVTSSGLIDVQAGERILTPDQFAALAAGGSGEVNNNFYLADVAGTTQQEIIRVLPQIVSATRASLRRTGEI